MRSTRIVKGGFFEVISIAVVALVSREERTRFIGGQAGEPAVPRNRYKQTSRPPAPASNHVFLGFMTCAKQYEIIRENNILQSRTTSRTIRVAGEIAQRLKTLTDAQIELLVEGNPAEKKYLLWFAVCKTYEFIREFAVEVVHEKFLSRSMTLTDLDYDAFFNRKADWNEGLGRITPSTRKKIRQVLLLMAKEAGLVTEDNLILRAMLSKSVERSSIIRFADELLVFPVDTL